MPKGMITVQKKREGGTCAVCLGEFDFNMMVRTTPCGHVFHGDCIDQWCMKNMSCPICRTDLTSENIIEVRNQKSRNQNSNWIMSNFEEEMEEESES